MENNVRVSGHLESNRTYVAPVINNSSIDQTLLIDQMFQEDDYKFPSLLMIKCAATEDHLPGTLGQSQQPKQAFYLQGLIKLIELACFGF